MGKMPMRTIIIAIAALAGLLFVAWGIWKGVGWAWQGRPSFLKTASVPTLTPMPTCPPCPCANTSPTPRPKLNVVQHKPRPTPTPTNSAPKKEREAKSAKTHCGSDSHQPQDVEEYVRDLWDKHQCRTSAD